MFKKLKIFVNSDFLKELISNVIKNIKYRTELFQITSKTKFLKQYFFVEKRLRIELFRMTSEKNSKQRHFLKD